MSSRDNYDERDNDYFEEPTDSEIEDAMTREPTLTSREQFDINRQQEIDNFNEIRRETLENRENSESERDEYEEPTDSEIEDATLTSRVNRQEQIDNFNQRREAIENTEDSENERDEYESERESQNEEDMNEDGFTEYETMFIHFAKIDNLEDLSTIFDSITNEDVKVHALIKAVNYHNFYIVQFLIENGVNVNSSVNNYYIIDYVNDLKIFKYLVENGALLHNNLLIENAEQDHYDIVKYLLENVSGINEYIDSALFIAGENGHFNMIKLLINNGANVHKIIDNNTILTISIHYDYDLKILQYLIKKGVDIHALDDKILIQSVFSNHYKITRYLLDNGANIHAKNDIVFTTKNKLMKNILNEHGQVNQKLFTNLKDTCNSDKLTDTQIIEISKMLNLRGTSRENLCSQISQVFKTKADNMNDDIGKCKTETTLLGTDIKDIPSLYFYIIHENNNLYCGDIREFIKINKNPWTNLKISEKQLDNIRRDYLILNTLFKNIEDEDEETLIEISIINTIRKVMNNVLSQLRYPKTVELFINANPDNINTFINELQFEGVLSQNDMNQINTINILDNKKLTLANILILKIQNEQQNQQIYSSLKEAIEDVYNKIF